jgi:hypothetical protein
MFVDREKELGYLEDLQNSGKAQFLVLYGRRRTGKTELLRQFSREKKHLFFTADLSSAHDQLRQLTEKVLHLTNDSFLRAQPFNSWEAALQYMLDHLSQDFPLIILDEFPYLCVSNRALPSILQKVWDQKSRTIKPFLILCGSYVSFMEKEILGAKSPLYGRRTGQLDLRPLGFDSLSDFFPGYTPEDLIRCYAILGGIPAYLERFDPAKTLEANVKNQILDIHSFLYAEPRFLLMEELYEPSLYFSILKAIAFGRTRLNEIVQETGISERAKVNKYLSVLRGLRIVKREVPITEDKPHKSRKGIYSLADHFIRFWFRYVYANTSALEGGDILSVWNERIAPDLENFTSSCFEEICAQKLGQLNSQGKLPFKAWSIGRWWDGSSEIDIVALDGKGSYLFCECKWTTKKAGTSLLGQLEQKADLFPDAAHKYFGFFSRSGFSPEFKAMARSRDDVFLFNYY